MNEKPTINFDAVPQEVKDRLSSATLAAVRRFLTQPGAEEILRREYEEYEKNSMKRQSSRQNNAEEH